MKQNNKIAISSWILAAIYLIYGGLLYTLVPKFTKIFTEIGVILPMPRNIVVSVPPGIWLLICCFIAILIIIRDISGIRSLFPDWAALMILIISAILFIMALFTPIFGPTNISKSSNISLQRIPKSRDR